MSVVLVILLVVALAVIITLAVLYYKCMNPPGTLTIDCTGSKNVVHDQSPANYKRVLVTCPP